MDFKTPLAQPQHDPRLGKDRRVVPLYGFQQLERSVIAGTGPYRRVEPRDRLQIVIVDVGPRRDDGFHRVLHLPAEVGCEDFDRRLRRRSAQRLDHFHELSCPAIGQVVAIDRSDDNMLQPELRRSLGDVSGFLLIDPARHPGLDVAEGAGPGAGVAQDHHRRMLLRPALADIGAGGLLAHGIEIQIAHKLARLAELWRCRRLHPDPVRFASALRARCVGKIGHAAQIVACVFTCQSPHLTPMACHERIGYS